MPGSFATWVPGSYRSNGLRRVLKALMPSSIGRNSSVSARMVAMAIVTIARSPRCHACYRTHLPLGSHFTLMRAPCSEGSLPSGDKLILITTSHS